jgi:hypothetical protein
VLIDFENVQVKSLALLTGDHFRVYLFLGPNNKKIPSELVIEMHSFGGRARYVQLETSAKDALDIQIAFYAGELAAAEPEGFFHILSKDKGFDPLIQHLKGRKIYSARSESIEEMPCFALARAAAIRDEGQAASSTPDNQGLVALVVADLEKRKAARPRRVATLRSTVQARLGKQNEPAMEGVMAELVRLGYVSTDGEKVSYNFGVAK